MAESPGVELIFRYRVRPGGQDRYREYLDEALPITEAREPYVSSYRIFRAADGSYLQHECYRDEAAIGRHLDVTASGQRAFADSTELLWLLVVGEVSEEFLERHGGPTVTDYRPFREVRR